MICHCQVGSFKHGDGNKLSQDAHPIRRRLASTRAISYFMALCSAALGATPAAAQAIVPNGYFTNVYVYQKSSPTETWEEHLTAANARDPGVRPQVMCPIPGLSNVDRFLASASTHLQGN